jgi:hypothetical protein
MSPIWRRLPSLAEHRETLPIQPYFVRSNEIDLDSVERRCAQTGCIALDLPASVRRGGAARQRQGRFRLWPKAFPSVCSQRFAKLADAHSRKADELSQCAQAISR